MVDFVLMKPTGAVGYVSFSDSIRLNGDRHMANARQHAAVGNKEFAFGSVRKAKRNYAKADEFDRLFSVPSHLKPAYELMKAQISANLYGA